MVNMQISVWSGPGGQLVTKPLGQGQPNMVLDPGSYSGGVWFYPLHMCGSTTTTIPVIERRCNAPFRATAAQGEKFGMFSQSINLHVFCCEQISLLHDT